MNILVTGAGGTIGTSLCTRLNSEYPNYRVIKFMHGGILLKKHNLTYSGDLYIKNHVKTVFKEEAIDTIVHLAVTRNPMNDPRIRSYATLYRDTQILFNLLEASCNVKKIVFASSATIFGSPEAPTDGISLSIATSAYIDAINQVSKRACINMTNIKNHQAPDPSNHFNHDDAHLSAENRMFNGTSKYINELVLHAFGQEHPQTECVSIRMPRVGRMG